MADFNPAGVLNTLKSTGNGGNRNVYVDSVAVPDTLAPGDNIRPCRVAGGTLVDRVVIKNDELDTNLSPTLAATIGFRAVDGSPQSPADVIAVAEDDAFANAAGTNTFEIFPPYLVERDSFLEINVTTAAATAAAGTVSAKVEGEAVGVA